MLTKMDVHYKFTTKLTIQVVVDEDKGDDEFSLRRKATVAADDILNGVSPATLGLMMTDPNLTETTNYVERSEP